MNNAVKNEAPGEHNQATYDELYLKYNGIREGSVGVRTFSVLSFNTACLSIATVTGAIALAHFGHPTHAVVVLAMLPIFLTVSTVVAKVRTNAKNCQNTTDEPTNPGIGSADSGSAGTIEG